MDRACGLDEVRLPIEQGSPLSAAQNVILPRSAKRINRIFGVVLLEQPERF